MSFDMSPTNWYVFLEVICHSPAMIILALEKSLISPVVGELNFHGTSGVIFREISDGSETVV
jgi:hypothetical protein